MLTADATGQRPGAHTSFRTRLWAQPRALVPALTAVALMLLWAAHNGGYDADTWYWGALAMLGVLAVALLALGPRRAPLARATVVALIAFSGYVAWSYLSMTWAQTPGWALEGSNRALLYLLVFALFAVVPWTVEAGLLTLLVFTVGIGAIAVVTLIRFASGDHVRQLADAGRLVFPTGYFNSSVALFMISALLSTVLAARRELPAILRGVLVAIAAASLQLCVVGQSRGWLFTLPLVVLIAIAVVPDRLRVAATAVLPVAATLIPVHKLLHALEDQTGPGLDHAGMSLGRTSLLICAAVLVVGTVLAAIEHRIQFPAVTPTRQRIVGAVVAVAVLVLAVGGADAATHGDPVGFVKRQWHGFIHPAPASASASHFASVGSGRYDFWRVSLAAVAAHPLGGLGQDNFADYYVKHRRTNEEPRWTHSIEMRLLAHTGIIGFALFGLFLVAATAAAARAVKRGDPLTRGVAAAATLPMVLWLIHGSVDWFWEFPALSAPALGFIALAGGLGRSGARALTEDRSRRRISPLALGGVGAIAFVAAVLVLAFPYLSIRELSSASNVSSQNPGLALNRLRESADLNPLNPDPVRLAGSIALATGDLTDAEKRFRQTIVREPGGWFGWFGAGLAASALGDTAQALHDYRVAASINSRVPLIKEALDAVDTLHPLTPGEALQMLSSA